MSSIKDRTQITASHRHSRYHYLLAKKSMIDPITTAKLTIPAFTLNPGDTPLLFSREVDPSINGFCPPCPFEVASTEGLIVTVFFAYYQFIHQKVF
jgi:hypothetical protein